MSVGFSHGRGREDLQWATLLFIVHANANGRRISWRCVRSHSALAPPSPICIALDVVSLPIFLSHSFVYRPREASRATQASIEVGALQSKLAACDLQKARTWLATCTKKECPFFFSLRCLWYLWWNHLESVSSPKQRIRSTSEAHRKRLNLVEPMSR